MGKLNEIMNTSEIVKFVLEQDEKSRNSDSRLYLQVLGLVGDQIGMDISRIAVPVFLEKSAEWGFPPFETVRRTRQKLQRKYPNLAACDTVQLFRSENETAFRAYARGGCING